MSTQLEEPVRDEMTHDLHATEWNYVPRRSIIPVTPKAAVVPALRVPSRAHSRLDRYDLYLWAMFLGLGILVGYQFVPWLQTWIAHLPQLQKWLIR